MTNPVAPPKRRGWIEAIREAALRFNDRLSRPVFQSPAGKAAPPRPQARGVYVPVGQTRQTG